MSLFGRQEDEAVKIARAQRIAIQRTLDIVEHGYLVRSREGIPDSALNGATSEEMDAMFARLRRVRDDFKAATTAPAYYGA